MNVYVLLAVTFSVAFFAPIVRCVHFTATMLLICIVSFVHNFFIFVEQYSLQMDLHQLLGVDLQFVSQGGTYSEEKFGNEKE